MEAILKIGASIGTPLALAGFTVGVLYLVYRLVLTRRLSRVLPGDTFRLLNQVARYVFVLALTAVVLGVSAYVAVMIFQGSVRVSVKAIRLEQEARQHLLQGYYSMALQETNTLVTLLPDDPVAYKLKAHAHYKLREYQSALNAFQDALARDPGFAAAKYGKGATLIALGDLKTAQGVYEQLRDWSPGDLDIRYNLAYIELATGNYKNAKDEYELIYKAGGPLKPNAAIGLGISEMLGRTDVGGSAGAVTYFQEAVCLSPKLRGVFLGTLREDEGEKYDSYIALLQRLEIDTGYRGFVSGLRQGKVC